MSMTIDNSDMADAAQQARFVVQSIHDRLRIPLADVLDPAQGWIIARFEPDPDSGVATVRDAFIDASGELVQPDDPEFVESFSGSWRPVANLGSGERRRGRRYEFELVRRESLAQRSPAPLVDPYVAGGLAVCKPAIPSASVPFAEVYLLPEEGADSFVRSLSLIAHNLDAFTAPWSRAVDRHLNRLTGGDDHLVAALALRRLAAEGSVQRIDVTRAARTRDLGERGSLVAAVLTAYLVGADSDLDRWFINEVASAAPTANDLLAAVLGVTATVSLTTSTQALARGGDALELIRDRLLSFCITDSASSISPLLREVLSLTDAYLAELSRGRV